MERKRINFDSRADWLEARKGGIGASEVATIMGLNPYESPLALWRRKVGIDPDKEENAAMKRGHYCEDAVAQWWAEETGREVIASSSSDFMFVDTEREYMRVSPDRTFWLPDQARNDDNKGILECKTTNMSVDIDDIPKTWFCQVQMNLGVANYQHGSLAWMGRGFEFGYLDIEFVPDFYAMLVEMVDKFWNVNVLQKIEPIPMSAQDVVEKYAKHTDGKIVEVDETVFEAYLKLKDVRSQISELEAQEKAMLDTLKMAFNDAEAITHDGQTLATWKASKPSMKFDSALFKIEQAELYDKYCKETQMARRFLIK